MKNAIFLFAVILNIVVLSTVEAAQKPGNRKIDSLIYVIKTSKPDTAKVTTLNILANEFRNNNPDTAIYFANQALVLANKINDKMGIANTYLNMGAALLNLGKYEKTMKFCNDALKIYDQLLSLAIGTERTATRSKIQKQIARAYSTIGSVMLYKDNYPEALRNFFIALKIQEAIGYKKGVAGSYGNIGTIYSQQGNYPDALKNYLAALKIFEEIRDKQDMAESYSEIGNIYFSQSNYPEALKNFLSSLKMNEETGNKTGIAKDLTYIGHLCRVQGNYPEALKNYFAASKIFEETRYKHAIPVCYNAIGIIYYRQGNYPEGLKILFNALKISEELGDKQGIASALVNIGNIYTEQSNYNEALKNYSTSLKISEEIGHKQFIAINLSNIGSIYEIQKNYPEALKKHFASLKIRKEIGEKEGIATSNNNIGYIYYKQANYSEALKFCFASLKIREETGDKTYLSSSYHDIGMNYYKQKQYDKASQYLNEALLVAKEIGNLKQIYTSYSGLAALDSSRGNFQQAFEHYKMYITYKDSIVNQEAAKKIVQTQMQYDFDKKESLAKAEQEKKDALALKELQNQKTRQHEYFIIGGVLLLLLIIGLIIFFRSKRSRDKEQLTTLFKKQLEQAETKALRAQMNPHFIFNCLNSINSLVLDQQHEIASEYLIKFSKLIRLILDNSRSETISIEKDLETLKLYVFLESARFDNKFTCVYRIADNINTNSVMIPPMLLQPFVENAIWHGLMQKEYGGTITVDIKKKNEELLNISITDDGIGREKAAQLKSKSATHKSHGLKVTSQRIEMMNKLNSTSAQVQIIDLKDGYGQATGTRIELIIPF